MLCPSVLVDMQKQTKITWGVILAALLIVGGYFAFRGANQNLATGDADGTLCAMDVRVCSDGSYVGRVAPSCDFAACPPLIPNTAPAAEFKD